jgi:hypothetical protein
MMTEAEAKTKWCPHARLQTSWSSPQGGVALAGINRWEKGNAKCIASECMAWRWTGRYDTRTEPKVTTLPTGYCGLAGKP